MFYLDKGGTSLVWLVLVHLLSEVTLFMRDLDGVRVRRLPKHQLQLIDLLLDSNESVPLLSLLLRLEEQRCVSDLVGIAELLASHPQM